MPVTSAAPNIELMHFSNVNVGECAERRLCLAEIPTKVSPFWFPKFQDSFNFICMQERAVSFPAPYGRVSFASFNKFFLTFKFTMPVGSSANYVIRPFLHSALNLVERDRTETTDESGETIYHEVYAFETPSALEYACLQFFCSADIISHRELLPGGSLLTYFVYPRKKSFTNNVIPPVITIQPLGCPQFAAVETGQLVQVITSGEKWFLDHQTNHRGLRFQGLESRELSNKDNSSVWHSHYYRYESNKNAQNEVLVIGQGKDNKEVVSAFIVSSVLRTHKNERFLFIEELEKKMVVFARNVDGLFLKKRSKPVFRDWYYDQETFWIFEDKEEVKIRFMGRQAYVIIEKGDCYWCLSTNRNLISLLRQQ